MPLKGLYCGQMLHFALIPDWSLSLVFPASKPTGHLHQSPFLETFLVLLFLYSSRDTARRVDVDCAGGYQIMKSKNSTLQEERTSVVMFCGGRSLRKGVLANPNYRRILGAVCSSLPLTQLEVGPVWNMMDTFSPKSWEICPEVLACSSTSCSNSLGFPFLSRAGKRTQKFWLLTEF